MAIISLICGLMQVLIIEKCQMQRKGGSLKRCWDHTRILMPVVWCQFLVAMFGHTLARLGCAPQPYLHQLMVRMMTPVVTSTKGVREGRVVAVEQHAHHLGCSFLHGASQSQHHCGWWSDVSHMSGHPHHYLHGPSRRLHSSPFSSFGLESMASHTHS